MLLWHTLATYFRRKYGVRVQKIPLDVGATCPNRDGTLSARGCIFCNDSGSGSADDSAGSHRSAGDDDRSADDGSTGTGLRRED